MWRVNEGSDFAPVCFLFSPFRGELKAKAEERTGGEQRVERLQSSEVSVLSLGSQTRRILSGGGEKSVNVTAGKRDGRTIYSQVAGRARERDGRALHVLRDFDLATKSRPARIVESEREKRGLGRFYLNCFSIGDDR